jgi:hypothetical protein
MNHEIYENAGPNYGMGFNWGSFIGSIGGALNQALNQNPYGQQNPNQYPSGQQTQAALQCTQAGGYYNPVTFQCIPRNTSGSDVSFQGSTFFWIIAGVAAFSLLSKRR